MTNPMAAADLEQLAASQRERLHESVDELRSNMRQRLDVQRAAHTYLWRASGVAALLSLAVGYILVGVFRD
jgi:hypothetical protein